MFPATVTIPTQQSITAAIRSKLDEDFASGAKRPIVFPYNLFGWSMLVAFLLIDHRQRRWLYQLRWPVWLSIVYFELNVIANNAALDQATSYMLGLISMWSIVWSSVWLVFTRPQFTAKRVERRRRSPLNDHSTSPQRRIPLDSKGRRPSQVASGWEMEGKSAQGFGDEMNGDATTAPTSETEETSHKVEVQNEEWEYFWQTYPDDFPTRLSWVFDLCRSFRGQGWNFSVPSNPALPPEIAEALGEPAGKRGAKLVSKVGVVRFRTRSELARYQLPKFVFCLMWNDLAKAIMQRDAYFLTGDTSYPTVPPLQGQSLAVVMQFRRLVGLISILTMIETAELLSPLVFCLLLGPSWLGIRGEAWMYPTTWGGAQVILDRGLNGLWGGWWHQEFRIGFAAPTNYLIRHGWIGRKTIAGQVTSLVIAFTISGLMHLAGSCTQILPTNPLGPLSFFMLQIPGVLLQTLGCIALKPVITKVPKPLRQAGNVAFTYWWMYVTSPPFVDDIARGGLWCFEPLPLSITRGWLNWGTENKWFMYDQYRLGIYHGKHWWQSGLSTF
jgi:hypothetical protein